jgi:hypothetical protein
MKLGRRLFSKYAVLIAALVAGALIASGLVGVYFSYRQNEAQFIALQQEKSYFAAWRIEQFIKDIEHQIGWTSLPRVAADALAVNERRFEYLKRLRQVPAITDVSWLDAEGRERLKVSRVAMDASDLDTDRSTEASFKAAKSGQTWFGPVYFRKETEPYLTIARSAGRDGGVTAAGTIHVAAKRNGAALELSVADTGIGIAPEDQGIIFEEFRQVGRDYTGKTEGTGLGLALTKRLVDLHGRSIRVESAVGQGSTFTVTLPLSHG